MRSVILLTVGMWWINKVCGSVFYPSWKTKWFLFEQLLSDTTEVLVRVAGNMQVYPWCNAGCDQRVIFIMVHAL